MIRLPPYIFFLGGFLTYASIFFSSAVVSMTMSVIGMTISLYIWYILAWNRDRHLAEMKKKGLVEPENLAELKITGNSRFWVVFYSAAYLTMNFTGLYIIKAIVEHVDIGLNSANVDELIELLGTGYILSSWLFFITGIAALFLYGKLITILYNDEMKIQSLESKHRNIPVLIIKPLSIALMVVFTLVTYGLFSWFMRYRLAAVQRFHNQIERKLDELEVSFREKAVEAQKIKKNLTQTSVGEEIIEKYSESLASTDESEERKEVIASLFRDLGSLKSDQARSLLRNLLSKQLLTENEFNKLIRLLV
ncbi:MULTISPECIES: hypothetical protein [unclassified Mesotoga]|uniref:hypothetical protein n=1 Tax=unclassified Mesotoga TaxID=1184398 RepID=UPI000EF288A2|nr:MULTISPECIES: hypothetical protein [unclassified Mesotoga]MDI9368003.1 hypothetical protein [Thermotogota bacterium]NLT43915.1 hypothetical protein [Thermotogaceae bacterium]MDD3680341.1 hypothetical protein [Mesotoga sp.]MDD4206916.1 hypothetical protein [Mesotoga sp.]MDD5682672.1 hypothetical protein [Mesotoga sp.]